MTNARFHGNFLSPGAKLRQHERAYFASTVRLLTPQRRLLEARTLDISLGGLKLVLTANLPVGTRCGLSMAIPVLPYGACTIVGEAEVSSILFSGRENGFLAGLRFTALPQSARAALQTYLQERHAHRARRSRLRLQVVAATHEAQAGAGSQPS